MKIVNMDDDDNDDDEDDLMTVSVFSLNRLLSADQNYQLFEIHNAHVSPLYHFHDFYNNNSHSPICQGWSNFISYDLGGFCKIG